MLRRGLIPTPLFHLSERQPLEVVELHEPRFFITLRSLQGLIGLGVLWLRLMMRRIESKERALQIRRYIEQQGGVWIKIGQLFAMRRDILPQVYCDELQRLTDSASAFPPEIARRIIEESLGSQIERFFDVFDSVPLAAASIGQVHRAHLRRERAWVAVKVKRPNIASVFERDLALVGWICHFCHRHGISPETRWEELYDELETMLMEELDYRIEAWFGNRLRRIVRKHRVYAPKVFLRYCTADILVMEFVDGVLMSEYIKMRDADPDRAALWCDRNRVRPRQVAYRLFETIQRQMLEEELFHADLHPGNIMLLRNSCIALLDFGSVGRLDGSLRDLWMRQSAWRAEGNYIKTVDMELQFAGTLPPIDVVTLTRRKAQLQRNRDFRDSVRTIPYEERSTAWGNRQLARLNREYKVPSQWGFMKLMRTFIVMETSVMHLDPQANFVRFGVKYQRRAQQRAEREGRVLSWLDNIRVVLSDLPAIMRTVSENVYFNSIILRREAKAMQTRALHLIRTALTFISTVVGLLTLLALAAFIYQTYNSITTGHFGSKGIVAAIRSLFVSNGYLEYLVWAVILLLLLNAYRKLKALRRLYSN